MCAAAAVETNAGPWVDPDRASGLGLDEGAVDVGQASWTTTTTNEPRRRTTTSVVPPVGFASLQVQVVALCRTKLHARTWIEFVRL